jgi:hypothetical protein
VASPISAPTRMAKFMKPILWLLKLYGGAAKFCDCVRLIVKKELQDQETTKAANSTMGKANNFHGIQRSRNIALKGCAFDWKSFHCCLLGVPLPRYGSRSAVACLLRSGIVLWVAMWVMSPPSFSGSLSLGSDVVSFSPEVAGETFASL